MGVSERVREIEKQIDTEIQKLVIWSTDRKTLLEQIMREYSNQLRQFHKLLIYGTCVGNNTAFEDAPSMENSTRAAILWLLKWANEFCSDKGGCKNIHKPVSQLVALGQAYETFVDTLKFANHDLIVVTVNEDEKLLTVYEGADKTGFDADIVNHQRFYAPLTTHNILTDDSDHLTSRWSAGDYRWTVRWLAAYAMRNADSIDTPLGDISYPTLLWLDRPQEDKEQNVFDDLVLPGPDMKWKTTSFLDTPIVKVGERYCTLSSDLMGLATMDDYMLRLAALRDSDQYTKVSQNREDRMVSTCRTAFEQIEPRWKCDSHVVLKDPDKEIDILAKRNDDTVVLQLKSTLRPETPWEVCKRNDEIKKGVRHTKSLIDRKVAQHGFVITDGYRGDYDCWAEALAANVPIGTLADVAAIASNPEGAAAEMKNKVGLGAVPSRHSSSPSAIGKREFELMGWTIRLIDDDAPSV